MCGENTHWNGEYTVKMMQIADSLHPFPSHEVKSFMNGLSFDFAGSTQFRKAQDLVTSNFGAFPKHPMDISKRKSSGGGLHGGVSGHGMPHGSPGGGGGVGPPGGVDSAQSVPT